MKTAGVYLIVLANTRFAYVGESSDIDRRIYQHQQRWLWPNDADVVVAREMNGASKARRRRTEAALDRLMRRRGYFMLSRTSSGNGLMPLAFKVLSRAGKIGASKLTKEHRQAGARKANAQRSPEQVRSALKKAHATMPQRARAMALLSAASRKAKKNAEATRA